MVMERTALSRAIGPLRRDGLVKVGAEPVSPVSHKHKLTPNRRGPSPRRARSALAAGAAIEYGDDQAADLRTVLQRVISVT